MSALEFEFDSEADIPTKGPSTGVDVRYHTKSEYNELSPDEKEELLAIRTVARRVNKDFGKKSSLMIIKNNGPKKKTREERRLVRKIKALDEAVMEKEETISAMRSAAAS